MPAKGMQVLGHHPRDYHVPEPQLVPTVHHLDGEVGQDGSLGSPGEAWGAGPEATRAFLKQDVFSLSCGDGGPGGDQRPGSHWLLVDRKRTWLSSTQTFISRMGSLPSALFEGKSTSIVMDLGMMVLAISWYTLAENASSAKVVSPLRHLIGVMRGHDLTKKKTMTKIKTQTKTMKKTNTFREHLQRAILETCDL